MAVYRLEKDTGVKDEETLTLFGSFQAAVSDYKLWLLALIIITKTTAGAVTQFIPTVVATFGMSRVQTQVDLTHSGIRYTDPQSPAHCSTLPCGRNPGPCYFKDFGPKTGESFSSSCPSDFRDGRVGILPCHYRLRVADLKGSLLPRRPPRLLLGTFPFS